MNYISPVPLFESGAAAARHGVRDLVAPGQPASAVIDAIVASYRSKAPTVQFHLIKQDGAAIGYGSTAVAPNGIGIVEHLFVRPERRSGSVMSAFLTEMMGKLEPAQIFHEITDHRWYLSQERGEAVAKEGLRPVDIAHAGIKVLIHHE